MAAVVILDIMAVADADFAMINDGPSWLHNQPLLLPGMTGFDHMIDNFHSHSCFVGFAVAAKTDLGRRNIIVIADVDIQADDTVLDSSFVDLGLKLSWLHNQNCIALTGDGEVVADVQDFAKQQQRRSSSPPQLVPPSL